MVIQETAISSYFLVCVNTSKPDVAPRFTYLCRSDIATEQINHILCELELINKQQ